MENKFQFIPYESPYSPDGKFDEAGILRSRREQLGLTQQEVAERAGIKVPQYQRWTRKDG